MTINEASLTHCPACGTELVQEPVTGDCRYFVCETHRRFGVSGTVIAMAHHNPGQMENLGRKILSARSPEDIEMITTLNLHV